MNEGERDPYKGMIEIGHFLSAFALLESASYLVFRLFPPDELAKHGQGLRQFQSRVRFAQAMLRGSDVIRPDRIEELFDDALKLAKLRNQVAHNPQIVSIYKNPKTGELETVGPVWMDAKKYGADNGELEISVKDVEEGAEQALKIWHDLMVLIHGSLDIIKQSDGANNRGS